MYGPEGYFIWLRDVIYITQLVYIGWPLEITWTWVVWSQHFQPNVYRAFVENITIIFSNNIFHSFSMTEI